MNTTVVWFRQDLRLADNPALTAAAASGNRVIPLWIDEPIDRGASQIGAAARVWLHHSLTALSHSLAERGVPMLVARGDAEQVLSDVMSATGATSLMWNRRYDPGSIAVDKAIKARFSEVSPTTFNGALLHEPWTVLKDNGDPYRVYTPYWRRVAARLQADGIDKPPPAPEYLPPWSFDEVFDQGQAVGVSTRIADLGLLPDKPWADAMMCDWHVGEVAAMARLQQFLSRGAASAYTDTRDLPGEDGTSMLSPALHHGELSPRQILWAVLKGRSMDALDDGETTFAKEVVWREFAHAMLYHFPDTLERPLDRRFERFVWASDAEEHLSAWRRGNTGVPIVDAGMRQLYATGWMHNRVRMIVASYLVKNLLIPWQEGEAWFRHTLVDADAASNTFGWQWAAGCGADAAPYFRVFNPVLQGEKFDRDGDYVLRWVPELASVPRKWRHKPWECPREHCPDLDYPEPLVDLKFSRQRALDAFAALKTA